MKPFTFVSTESLEEAVAALHAHGDDARVLAGGQSLLLLMKDRLLNPAVLVSIGRVGELRGHQRADGLIQIGSATTYAELEHAPLGAGASALVNRVCADVADIPVRRMGTIGGALCQADPQFDFPVAAVALEAGVELASARGRRTLAVAEFLKGRFETARAPDEILAAVRFRAGDDRTGVAFEKFALRRFDAAIASVACVLRVGDDGEAAEVRIACGGVAETPMRAGSAEQAIAGNRVTEKLAEQAGRLISADLSPTLENPLLSTSYRRQLIGTLITRALLRAYAAAVGH